MSDSNAPTYIVMPGQGQSTTHMRNEPRVRVRVNVRPVLTSVPRAEDDVFNGRMSNSVYQGIQEFVCFESDLPMVRALVEDKEQLLELSKETHENNLRHYLEQQYKKKIPADKKEWDDNLRRLSKTYDGNPIAEFNRLVKRDPKPLISMEVIEREIPAPRPEDKKQLAQLVQDLKASENADLTAVLTKLTELIAMQAKASAPPPAPTQYVGKKG